MFPTSQTPTPPRSDGGGLEERLRGLILSNANDKTAPGAGAQPPISSYVLPHISAATPVEQQDYMANPGPRHPASSFPSVAQGGSYPSSQTDSRSQPGGEDSSSMPLRSPQQGRKRLNQAQRRQMNSQLSASLDARQNTAPNGRGYSPSHGNGRQGYTSSQSDSSPRMNYNQRYLQHQHQQKNSPRFPNQNPSPQFSRQPPYSQQYRQSPMNFNSSGPASGYGSQYVQASEHMQPYQYANRVVQGPSFSRPPPENRLLYQLPQNSGQSRGRVFTSNPEEIAHQISCLAVLLQDCVPTVGIDEDEEAEKETFRAVVENACREAILQYEREELGNPTFDASSVELKCFGSMSSGFATRASDMDLALLTPLSNPTADSPESPIPRLLEKKLLDMGYGARLLTRTRVPIIKLCQKPTPKLLSGLLEARTKWENGFVTEADEEEEEEAVEIDTKHATEEEQPQKRKNKRKSAKSPELSSTNTRLQNSTAADNQLIKLKQKDNQSLSDYFNMAKRLLRKIGGRDIAAGSPALTMEECNLLNNVCKAFVSGLSSPALSLRLRSCHNILPLFDSSLPPIQRTLNGIWSQIEGERFAMAFEKRPLTEPNEKQEQDCLKLVEEWRSLQNQTTKLVEPLAYNRQLYMAAEKLKAFSSLQLVLLEQIQHEDPFYYHKRVQRIYDGLKSRDQSTPDSATPIIISSYISGISNSQIRQTLQDPSQRDSSLKDVALAHRVLQLALDYEHALSQNLYDDQDRPVIQEYVAFLRNRTQGRHVDPALIAKIRDLPDPTVMSLNKPQDRYRDKLEFPKTEVGIQCDINFAAQLALHNTLLLRCYSHCDPRVKPLVLFIKHWAKVRGINTPYRGSLSSYGYVLMVLHYFVNIAQPFVCPNLQLIHKEPTSHFPQAEADAQTTCMGRDVQFWRNESEIKSLSGRGLLSHNHDSVGMLLRGFFEYFAQGGQMTTVHGRGFDWGREVLSLRTQGGIVSKVEKGWVSAKTTVETTTVAAPLSTANPAQSKESSDVGYTVSQDSEPVVLCTKPQAKMVEETKEIRHRYLFAIEDPFELDHNVARTVTHNGIVSIRDEFRRAWRLIKNMGRPGQTEGILDPVGSGGGSQPGQQELLDLIHGRVQKDAKA